MTSSRQPVFAHDTPLAEAVARLCRAEADRFSAERFPERPAWRSVRAAGSDVWLDSCDLDANRRVWSEELSGVTTNNALLDEEVEKGIHDELVPRAAAAIRAAEPALPEAAVVQEVAFVLNAVHSLALARTFDAAVSVELHTDLARDIEASYAYGRRCHALDPERLVVKIALTPEGVLAAQRLERDGVRVNMTLGFSPRQNHLVALVARPHFVNVFLGRINSFFEQDGLELVTEPGREPRDDHPLEPGELAVLRSQRMLRDDAIREGRPTPRQIAASMRHAGQVRTLAGVDVLTMPVSVAEEFLTSADGGDLTDRTAGELPADVAPRGAPGLSVFFELGSESRIAAEQLLVREPDAMDGARLRAVLADSGMGDLFPDLDEHARARLAAAGKIPHVDTWSDRVEKGAASWDGLLTEAALAGMARAQSHMDARVRRLMR